MGSLRTITEVQSLTRRVAALNRIISRSLDKRQEFFKVIKKGTEFEWTEKCEIASGKLKLNMLLPMLAKPTNGEKVFNI